MAFIPEIVGQLASALLLGGMVFFAAVTAPMVFIHLDAANAGKLIRAIFPWYYLYVIVTAAISAGVYVVILPWAAAGFGLVALGALYARQGLMPQINHTRDAMLAGDENAGVVFNRLHKRSVRINAVGLLAAIAAVVHHAIVG